MWAVVRSKLLVVEPGNMTRYTLLVSRLDTGFGDEELRVLGLSKGGYIATLVNFRNSPSILFGVNSFLAAWYVAEKLGINEVDAREVARALAAELPGIGAEALDSVTDSE